MLGLPKRLFFAVMLLFAPVAPAAAKEVVSSPDGRIVVTVDVNGESRPFYRIDLDGEPLFTESRLSFLLTDQDKLERRLSIVSGELGGNDSTWEQPWGERRFVRDHYNQLTVRFEEASEAKRSFLAMLITASTWPWGNDRSMTRRGGT